MITWWSLLLAGIWLGLWRVRRRRGAASAVAREDGSQRNFGRGGF